MAWNIFVLHEMNPSVMSSLSKLSGENMKLFYNISSSGAALV